LHAQVATQQHVQLEKDSVTSWWREKEHKVSDMLMNKKK
jgi:hypothetical protein